MTIHHFTAGYHLPLSPGTGELYVPSLPLRRCVSFQQEKKLGQTTSISISNCNQTAPFKPCCFLSCFILKALKYQEVSGSHIWKGLSCMCKSRTALLQVA